MCATCGRADTLAQLSWDHIAITDLFYHYAEALDQRDEESLKPLFAEDVRDEMLQNLLKHGDAMQSTHVVNNVRVHLQGKLARVTAYMLEKHTPKGGSEGGKKAVSQSRYEAECHLDKAIWRIRSMKKVDTLWSKGDASLAGAQAQ